MDASLCAGMLVRQMCGSRVTLSVVTFSNLLLSRLRNGDGEYDAGEHGSVSQLAATTQEVAVRRKWDKWWE